jgi:hypothetical protein
MVTKDLPSGVLVPRVTLYGTCASILASVCAARPEAPALTCLSQAGLRQTHARPHGQPEVCLDATRRVMQMLMQILDAIPDTEWAKTVIGGIQAKTVIGGIQATSIKDKHPWRLCISENLTSNAFVQILAGLHLYLCRPSLPPYPQ